MNFMLKVKHLPLTDGRVLVGEQPIPAEYKKERTTEGYRINGVDCRIVEQTTTDIILEVN